MKIGKTKVKVKRELFTFIVVGGISTLADFLTYFAMVSFEIDKSLSKILSFIVGTSVGYFGNSRITFRQSSGSVAKYFLVYLFSLIVNVWINNLAYSTSADAPLSWLLATFSSTSINFIGLRYFAFSRKV